MDAEKRYCSSFAFFFFLSIFRFFVFVFEKIDDAANIEWKPHMEKWYEATRWQYRMFEIDTIFGSHTKVRTRRQSKEKEENEKNEKLRMVQWFVVCALR